MLILDLIGTGCLLLQLDTISNSSSPLVGRGFEGSLALMVSLGGALVPNGIRHGRQAGNFNWVPYILAIKLIILCHVYNYNNYTTIVSYII